MILIAALSRLIPHPPNMTPLTAMALFSGVYARDKRLALAVPLLALLLSDLIIGLHMQMPIVYLCFAGMVFIGSSLKSRPKVLPLSFAVLGSSILFFVVTNFGVWLLDGLYPRSFQGLIVCYTAAIPFFRNTLLGDLFYAALLFGSFMFAEKRFSALREGSPAISV